VPSIVKPAPQTAYVTELCVRQIADVGLLPEGALQLLIGDTDGLLDGLTGRTCSASPAPPPRPARCARTPPSSPRASASTPSRTR
jgi:hypothetical protein